MIEDRGAFGSDPAPGAVDAGAVLRAARERAHLSQTQLSVAAGCARSVLNGYECGRRSPTLRMLATLLAACGLQARVVLEPLMAGLDARVDALSGEVPELEIDRWTRLATSLDDRPAPPLYPGAPPMRRGPVTWAVDGGSALLLHHLAVHPSALSSPELVVVLDDALRYWMRAVMLKGYDERQNPVQDWLDADRERIVSALAGDRHCLVGFVRLRVVDALPVAVRQSVLWSPDPVAVVTVDEVERSHPVHAEVLARWRTTRGSR